MAHEASSVVNTQITITSLCKGPPNHTTVLYATAEHAMIKIDWSATGPGVPAEVTIIAGQRVNSGKKLFI